MNKEELVKSLAKKTQISEEQSGAVINAFVEEIKKQLTSGQKVTIAGFGTFVLSRRGPKEFVNPKTGQVHELPERFLPHFKAGDGLQKNLKQK